MAPSIPMRQAARTPRRPYMPPLRGVPYAFAIEVREFPDAVVTKIRCPLCGHTHEHARDISTIDGWAQRCANGMGAYVIAVPEGTPIMVPVA